MVLPLLAAGAIGAGSVLLADFMNGGKKGDVISTSTTTSEANIYHQPYENYNPVTTYSPVMSYAYEGPSYIINSAGASISKKQAATLSANPDTSSDFTAPSSAESAPSTTQGAQGGVLENLLTPQNFLIFGALAGVVIIGTAYVGRKK
jgi:hypothetical protein